MSNVVIGRYSLACGRSSLVVVIDAGIFITFVGEYREECTVLAKR